MTSTVAPPRPVEKCPRRPCARRHRGRLAAPSGVVSSTFAFARCGRLCHLGVNPGELSHDQPQPGRAVLRVGSGPWSITRAAVAGDEKRAGDEPSPSGGRVGGLAVGSDDAAAAEGESGPAGDGQSFVGAVIGAGVEIRGVEAPGGVRVEDDEVGVEPWADRPFAPVEAEQARRRLGCRVDPPFERQLAVTNALVRER